MTAPLRRRAFWGLLALALLLALGCCVYGVISLLRLGYLLPASIFNQAVSTLVWDGAQLWRLCDRAGQWQDAQLRVAAWNSEYLLILHFAVKGSGPQVWYKGFYRQKCLILTRDNCDPDEFRRLRGRLKWMKNSLRDNSVE